MNKKNSLFIVSAADRYNFGDLLFNHIVKSFLYNEICNKYQIYYVSLLGSDLINLQGHKTIGLKKLNRKIEDGDIIILAGGGLLGHNWSAMFYQKHDNILIKIFRKILGNTNFEEFLRLIVFSSTNKFPFTFSKTNFNKRTKIIYNSVGGGALINMNEIELREICDILSYVDYIAVRDDDIFTNLIKCSDIKHLLKGPDSAILFSEIYSKKVLFNSSSTQIKKILNDNYLVLHFNEYIANKYKVEIDDLIHFTKIETGLKIILLPVNFINDADRNGQQLFVTNLDCQLIDFKPKLFEICALIAFSKLLIGSSLHTNIIASSYAIPHMGFTREVRKVNHFFETWYNDDTLFNSHGIQELKECILPAIENSDFIKEKSDLLKFKAKENFKIINYVILKDN